MSFKYILSEVIFKAPVYNAFSINVKLLKIGRIYSIYVYVITVPLIPLPAHTYAYIVHWNSIYTMFQQRATHRRDNIRSGTRRVGQTQRPLISLPSFSFLIVAIPPCVDVTRKATISCYDRSFVCTHN